MKKHGLSPDFRFVQTIEPTIKAAYDCTRSLLLLNDRPTAFFCTNDAIAVGTVKAALRSGLSVPGDISVIGYDNSDYCNVLEPELTSVHTDKDKMGRITVDYLSILMNGMLPEQKIATVESKLILRQTTN
jgi:DNA-binding LacI/PurR family transcriptional regulator